MAGQLQQTSQNDQELKSTEEDMGKQDSDQSMTEMFTLLPRKQSQRKAVEKTLYSKFLYYSVSSVDPLNPQTERELQVKEVSLKKKKHIFFLKSYYCS